MKENLSIKNKKIYITVGALAICLSGFIGFNISTQNTTIDDVEEIKVAVEEKDLELTLEELGVSDVQPVNQNDIIGGKETENITIIGSDDKEVVNVDETSTEKQPTIIVNTKQESEITASAPSTQTTESNNKTTPSTSNDSSISTSTGSGLENDSSSSNNNTNNNGTSISPDTNTNGNNNNSNTVAPKETIPTPAPSDNPRLNPTGSLGGGGEEYFDIEENGIPGEGDKF